MDSVSATLHSGGVVLKENMTAFSLECIYWNNKRRAELPFRPRLGLSVSSCSSVRVYMQKRMYLYSAQKQLQPCVAQMETTGRWVGCEFTSDETPPSPEPLFIVSHLVQAPT